MAAASDAPVELAIAVYADWSAAHADWDDLKELVRDGRLVVDGMVLIRRGSDAIIRVTDDFHEAGAGAVGGLLVGLAFPPALLASEAGADGLVSGRSKQATGAEVADVLPSNSSAIVALFEELWTAPLERALGKADRTTRYEIDRTSADAVKAAAASGARAS